ncbi:hypothetical protein AAZX31_18G123100 [Glycine max]
MLYGKPYLETTSEEALVNFLRIGNLTYMCRLIHNFLLNTVMPILGAKDYVSDKDKFCMYKVMVGEKVNLPEVIFFKLLQAFKDIFHTKDKKNRIPYEMFFTQIIRNGGMDVSVLELSIGATQIKCDLFKMGVAANFLEYAQKHIKRKVKNKPKKESQYVAG